MKRVLAFIALLAGCASSPAEIHAYCQRWAAKYVSFGTHAEPAAYHEDLVSTCMALKHTPYNTQQQSPPPPPILAASEWVNPSVSKADSTKTFGRDKANCIERGYVGQASQGSNSGQVRGYGSQYGSSIGGSQSGSYNSAPAFNNELFVACMNAAGWELIDSDP